MKIHVTTALVLALAASACQMGGAGDKMAVDPLDTALRGKTLTNVENPAVIVNLNADGSLAGSDDAGNLTGTWEIRDGQYCRTIVTPERWKGTACQSVTIDGNTATFIRENGTSSSYTMS